jgi:hypothetical protein
MWRRVFRYTDVSEERVASIFRVEEKTMLSTSKNQLHLLAADVPEEPVASFFRVEN